MLSKKLGGACSSKTRRHSESIMGGCQGIAMQLLWWELTDLSPKSPYASLYDILVS